MRGADLHRAAAASLVATARIEQIGRELQLPASIISKYGVEAAVFQDSQLSQLA